MKDIGPLLLLAAAGAAVYYFWSQNSVTIGTTANPILVPGVGPVSISNTSITGGAIVPAGTVYGPTDTQLGL
jgi:hypothetical protein